jgi:fatty acid synthase
VDVVLNSLSGEKLQASLDCVGQYGHFCEIGKYDIQQNMHIGMGIFERNVSIHGFDLSDMFSKPRLWQPVRDLLSAGLQWGEVQPLCLTVFEEPEQALRHVSTGKHIGKVLVRLPPIATTDRDRDRDRDRDMGVGSCPPPPSSGITRHLRSFRTGGTHLVVGGLGGFGFELVVFLQARGADRVIIASRSEPKPYQQRLLGNTVRVTHVDLKDAQACDGFLQTEGSELVGIWHLGMVLNDCLHDNMTAAAWEETVSTKANICQNLDSSSRAHCKGLRHFVMWSSVSALFGNPGQTNYAYANSAMEGVCLSRKEAGLPGVAIQWGFIGSVGVLMKNQATNTSLGFSPQHIDSCLDSLYTILSSDHAVVSCYIRQVDHPAEGEGGGGAKSLSISQRIARVLGLDPFKINSTDMLSSLGMDSLQSVEIANVLKVAGLATALDELRALTWTEILTFD